MTKILEEAGKNGRQCAERRLAVHVSPSSEMGLGGKNAHSTDKVGLFYNRKNV